MTSFLIFDAYESLMMNLSEFSKQLSMLSLFPELTQSLVPLESLFETIKTQSVSLIDSLINSHLYECSKSEKLSKKLLKSKSKAKKYLTLQQQLSYKQTKIQLKNKSLTSSLRKLKKIWKDEVNDLESSLKKQRKTHSKLSFQYSNNLDEIEKEIKNTLETPILANKKIKEVEGDTSCEFDYLMKEISIGQDFACDNSRISMEKNQGGWVSEYDSDRDSKCESEDIKNAIKVLVKANLIGEEGSLNKISEMIMSEDRSSENLELILQLMEIQKKGKKSLQSLDVNHDNEFESFQGIVSPIKKMQMMFESSEFQQDSILEIN